MAKAKSRDIAFHPLANIFPAMPDDALSALTADILKNGLRNPIVLFEDKILDGRSRYLACKRAKVEPTMIKLDAKHGGPTAYVYSVNAHRRHLSKFQIAVLAAEYRQASKEKLSLEEAGEKFGVNKVIVSYADRLLHSGDKELVALARDPETTQRDAKAALEAKGLAEVKPKYDASQNLTYDPITDTFVKQAPEDNPVKDEATAAPAAASAAAPRAETNVSSGLSSVKRETHKPSEATVTHVQAMQQLADTVARTTAQDLEAFAAALLERKIWERLCKAVAVMQAKAAKPKAKANVKVPARPIATKPTHKGNGAAVPK